MPHAIVIGAGPAGSAAAYLLARAQWRVTLIEQHRFPRDKVCGECLSSLGFDVLKRIGLAGKLRTAAPVPLQRAALFAPSGESLVVELPQTMWGISRDRLDQILLNAARDAGTCVLQPVRCERLSGDDHPAIVARDLKTNREIVYAPDWILLADGKAGLLQNGPAPTGDFGVKAHFTSIDAPADCIELFSLDGHYVGIAPIDQERWNLAMSVPQARLKEFAGDFDSLLQRLQQENITLARQLSRASRVSRWLSAPLPRFALQRRCPSRVIPLGNAAAAMEPIGGEGMGLALRSAELAAEALLSNASPETIDQRLRGEFNSLWQMRRFACRTAALLASRPRLADAFIPMMSGCDELVRNALKLCGKS